MQTWARLDGLWEVWMLLFSRHCWVAYTWTLLWNHAGFIQTKWLLKCHLHMTKDVRVWLGSILSILAIIKSKFTILIGNITNYLILAVKKHSNLVGISLHCSPWSCFEADWHFRSRNLNCRVWINFHCILPSAYFLLLQARPPGQQGPRWVTLSAVWWTAVGAFHWLFWGKSRLPSLEAECSYTMLKHISVL